jgi:hypothetical protein
MLSFDGLIQTFLINVIFIDMAKRKIIGKKHGNRKNISKNRKRIQSNNEILKKVK